MALRLHGDDFQVYLSPDSCERRAAPQHDWAAPKTPEDIDSWTMPSIVGHTKFTLAPDLIVVALDIEWSCPACHEREDDAPLYQSTRLVVFDRRKARPRVGIYYASIGSYCRLRRAGERLLCDGLTFDFRPEGFVEVKGSRSPPEQYPR